MDARVPVKFFPPVREGKDNSILIFAEARRACAFVRRNVVAVEISEVRGSDSDSGGSLENGDPNVQLLQALRLLYVLYDGSSGSSYSAPAFPNRLDATSCAV
jgi:hypothetical protein